MGVGEGLTMWEGEDMYVFYIANGRSLAVALVSSENKDLKVETYVPL